MPGKFQVFKDNALIGLLRKSLAYGAGDVIQRSLAILLLPVYTRYLSAQDYGIIGLLGTSSMLLSALTICGLTNGICRYFYYAQKENESHSSVIWSAFIFILVFSLFILVPLGFACRKISGILFNSGEYGYLVVLTLLTVFISNLSRVGRSILLLQERAMTANLINIVGVVSAAAYGIFSVVHLKRGISGAVEAGLIGSLVMSIPLLLSTVFRFKYAFSLSMLKSELKFSLPLVAAVFAFWVIDYSDRYILKAYLPLSEVGLYNIGYYFGLAIMIAVEGFNSAWPAFYHKHNQHGQGQSICGGALKVYLLTLSVCVVCLSIGSPLLLKLFTMPVYHAAFTVVPWIALAYMLKGPYLIFLMGILMKNRTLWQLYLECGVAIASVAGNIILVPFYGRESAAIMTFISYAILSLGAYVMVMRVNPIPRFPGVFSMVNMAIAVVFSMAVLFIDPAASNYLFILLLTLVAFLSVMIAVNMRQIRPILAGNAIVYDE